MALNPYAAPHSNLEHTPSPGGEAEIALISTEGRLGRVRFIAYSLGLLLPAVTLDAVMGGVSLALPGTWSEWLWTAFLLMTYPTLLALWVMVMIQRIHDLSRSGWWALLIFVPIANLFFWLALYALPGTASTNRFGARPPPNSLAVKVCALALSSLALGLAINRLLVLETARKLLS